MSRTDKDRPWFIRALDDTVTRTEVHRHRMFGDPIYDTQPVLDDNGVQAFEMKSVYSRYTDDDGIEQVGWHDELLPAWERIFVGYTPDYCTIDEVKQARNYDELMRFPCYYVERQTHYRPDDEEKRIFHGGKRARQRQGLHSLVKNLRSNDVDADDFLDDERLYEGSHIHEGAWH